VYPQCQALSFPANKWDGNYESNFITLSAYGKILVSRYLMNLNLLFPTVRAKVAKHSRWQISCSKWISCINSIRHTNFFLRLCSSTNHMPLSGHEVRLAIPPTPPPFALRNESTLHPGGLGDKASSIEMLPFLNDAQVERLVWLERFIVQTIEIFNNGVRDIRKSSGRG